MSVLYMKNLFLNFQGRREELPHRQVHGGQLRPQGYQEAEQQCLGRRAQVTDGVHQKLNHGRGHAILYRSVCICHDSRSTNEFANTNIIVYSNL